MPGFTLHSWFWAVQGLDCLWIRHRLDTYSMRTRLGFDMRWIQIRWGLHTDSAQIRCKSMADLEWVRQGLDMIRHGFDLDLTWGWTWIRHIFDADSKVVRPEFQMSSAQVRHGTSARQIRYGFTWIRHRFNGSDIGFDSDAAWNRHWVGVKVT